MWLAGASLLAILLGSADANAITFGFGDNDFVIPSTGWYDFTLAGAEGSDGSGSRTGGGLGALVGGELFLASGTPLEIVVGGLAGSAPPNFSLYGRGGGGGGR